MTASTETIGGRNHSRMQTKRPHCGEGAEIVLWPFQGILPFRSEFFKGGRSVVQEFTKRSAHVMAQESTAEKFALKTPRTLLTNLLIIALRRATKQYIVGNDT